MSDKLSRALHKQYTNENFRRYQVSHFIMYILLKGLYEYIPSRKSQLLVAEERFQPPYQQGLEHHLF